MTMEDWAKYLDTILTATGEDLLIGNGAISHMQAMDKAETLSNMEKDYLESIKVLEKEVKQ